MVGVAGGLHRDSLSDSQAHKSARLELTIEDIAAVGQENFESILRENLSLALSAELDKQGLNGAGAGTTT